MYQLAITESGPGTWVLAYFGMKMELNKWDCDHVYGDHSNQFHKANECYLKYVQIGSCKNSKYLLI